MLLRQHPSLPSPPPAHALASLLLRPSLDQLPVVAVERQLLALEEIGLAVRNDALVRA